MASTLLLYLPLLLLLRYPLITEGLHLVFNDEPYYTKYSIFTGKQEDKDGGKILLFRSEKPISVFAGGRWCVASGAKRSTDANDRNFPSPLLLEKHETVQGDDDELGSYRGLKLIWKCKHSNSDYNSTIMETTVKNFDSGDNILFEINFPLGALRTSTVEYEGASSDSVMVHFPSLNTNTAILPSVLSWEGSFIQGVNRHSVGPRGGPTVFYNASDPFFQHVLVASGWGGNWKTYSSGEQQQRHKNNNSIWSPGTSGRITSLPVNYKQSIILHAGYGGITSTLAEWGQILQRSRKSYKVSDVTLETIGYQTDNGAYYCFCRERNCSETLIRVVESLRSQGILLGYLSFQGAGASSGRGSAAPWCVERWGVDGGLDRRRYPLDLENFQRAVGVPLQLYAPYFCPGSPYFEGRKNNSLTPGKTWKSVHSNTSLPGCSDFDFQDVHPSQSRAFYDWFFERGIKAGGMVSFEPDFMNQNFNCVPEFIHSTDAVQTWHQGMAGAAQGKNISVQWCYATPTDVLAALDMPSITNFRVSFDYCYGNSWNIGVSSLLVWALGASPSKDTLWTTSNNRTVTPGCSWAPDHETPAAELHLILALFSTGPVGISDALGMTNDTLVRGAISQEGKLLKPSKAASAIDSSFMLPSAGGLHPEEGYVYATYGSGQSWYFVSFKITKPYPVKVMDFWPPIRSSFDHGQHQKSLVLAYRHFRQNEECYAGADAVQSGCVQLVLLDSTALKNPLHEVFSAPISSWENVTGGSDFAPTLISVWQSCPESGWIFLGESLQKYVALSPARFIQVTCTPTGVVTTIEGGKGEVIELIALEPHEGARDVLTVVRVDVAIPDSGKGFAKFTSGMHNQALT